MKRKYYLIIASVFFCFVMLCIYYCVTGNEDLSLETYSLSESDLGTKALERKSYIPPFSKEILSPKTISSSKPDVTDLLDETPVIPNMTYNQAEYMHPELKPGTIPFSGLNSSIGFRSQQPLDYLQNTALLIGYDLYRTIEKPFYWDTNDFYRLVAITAGTFLVSRIDDDFNSKLKPDREVINKDIFKVAEYYGRNTTVIFSAIGFNLAGFIACDPELNIIGVELFEAFLVSETLSNFLKNSFGRSRPYLNTGSNIYNTFDPQDNSQKSLPSGHTIMAFTISSVLSSHIKKPWLKTAVFIPALLTGIQRMYSQNHWASDVFLGAAIGYFVGQSITSLHNYDRNYKIIFTTNHKGEIGLVIPLN